MDLLTLVKSYRMTLSDIHSFYQNQIEKHTENLIKCKSIHKVWTMLRVFIFVLIPTIFFLFPYSGFILLTAVLLTVSFFFTVNKWVDSKRAMEVEQNHIDLCKQELAVLAGDWSSFGQGIHFQDGRHPFTHDLDVFGKNGFFTYLNRTVTVQGEKRLAEVIANGTVDVHKSNENIKYLATQMEWVHDFIASSKGKVEEPNEKMLSSLLPKTEGSIGYQKAMRMLVPVLSFLTITAYFIPKVSFPQLLMILTLSFVLARVKSGAVNKWMVVLDKERYRIQALQAQLESLQKLAVADEKAKGLFDESLLDVVKSLSSIQKLTAYRMNAVVNFLLNTLFGWDALLMIMIRKFEQTHFDKLDELELHLANVEVWISGAKMAFNNPQHTYAKWTKDDFNFKDLSHPFVPIEQRVTNDFQLTSEECAIILTGPNMAGKSTYLRSVGSAIFMANAGLPILASEVHLPKVELYTSMRTSDDLLANSSYFHAELHRLRFIVDAIESGKKVFFILDEILKGTNSKDKEEGSALFLEKLKSLGAQGIIATHDLSLTNLANIHSSFRNYYFDSTITGDILTFDYKIREGVCRNMNASFLLRQLNLVID